MQHNLCIQAEGVRISDKRTSQQVNIARNKAMVNHVSTAVSVCNNVVNVRTRG